MRKSGGPKVIQRNMRNFQRLKVRNTRGHRGFSENPEKRVKTESSGKSRSRVYPERGERISLGKKSRKSRCRFPLERDRVDVRPSSSYDASDGEVEKVYREETLSNRSFGGKVHREYERRGTYQNIERTYGEEKPCKYEIRDVDRESDKGLFGCKMPGELEVAEEIKKRTKKLTWETTIEMR